MPTLSASSYVVLGLLDRFGSTTPYGLDRSVRQTIGYFWAFPRSQLYAEAARLMRHGLVVEEREDTGRRRRMLSITPAGQAAFAQWLTGPADRFTEIRDEGLLRLSFCQQGPADEAEVRRIALEQLRAHRQKLAEYNGLLASMPVPGDSPQAATLTFGLRFERMAIAFWGEIAEDGTSAVNPTLSA